MSNDLPEITLEHVEFGEESWDFGQRHGMYVKVPAGSDEPLLRWAVSYPAYAVVVPPKSERRLVTFDRGDGTIDTEEEVWVTIEPGVTRELTAEELAAKKEEACEELVSWLRHVAAAHQYLAPVLMPSDPSRGQIAAVLAQALEDQCNPAADESWDLWRSYDLSYQRESDDSSWTITATSGRGDNRWNVARTLRYQQVVSLRENWREFLAEEVRMAYQKLRTRELY